MKVKVRMRTFPTQFVTPLTRRTGLVLRPVVEEERHGDWGVRVELESPSEIKVLHPDVVVEVGE